MLGTILWAKEQDTGDFDNFLWVLGLRILALQGLWHNFPKVGSTMNPTKGSVARRRRGTPDNILWAKEQKTNDFDNFLWVLAHKYWCCSGIQ